MIIATEHSIWVVFKIIIPFIFNIIVILILTANLLPVHYTFILIYV